MPDPWVYSEQPERPAHPPAQLAGSAPWRPPQYDPAQHRQRLAPPAVPPDLAPRGPRPGSAPAAQPQYPHRQDLPPVFQPGYSAQPAAQGYYPPPRQPYGPPPPRQPYGPPPPCKKSTGLKVRRGRRGLPPAHGDRRGRSAVEALRSGRVHDDSSGSARDDGTGGGRGVQCPGYSGSRGAKGYMNDGQGFSRQGLIEQMTSAYGNKFTQAQAEYAANALGL
jgi:hypothetical protein